MLSTIWLESIKIFSILKVFKIRTAFVYLCFESNRSFRDKEIALLHSWTIKGMKYNAALDWSNQRLIILYILYSQLRYLLSSTNKNKEQNQTIE